MQVLQRSDTGNLSEFVPPMSATANELQRQRIPLTLDAYITKYVKPRLSKEQAKHTVTRAFGTIQAKLTEG